MIRISLCDNCALGRDGFATTLDAALQNVGVNATVSGIGCMSGCARESTAAFRARGKVAYLFGDLTAADLDDLVTFARLYAASPDGVFVDARPLGGLRTKALARIPG
jgi:predicted metal-binding protein